MPGPPCPDQAFWGDQRSQEENQGHVFLTRGSRDQQHRRHPGTRVDTLSGPAQTPSQTPHCGASSSPSPASAQALAPPNPPPRRLLGRCCLAESPEKPELPRCPHGRAHRPVPSVGRPCQGAPAGRARAGPHRTVSPHPGSLSTNFHRVRGRAGEGDIGVRHTTSCLPHDPTGAGDKLRAAGLEPAAVWSAAAAPPLSQAGQGATTCSKLPLGHAHGLTMCCHFS